MHLQRLVQRINAGFADIIALVIDDSSIKTMIKYDVRERLERTIYLGNKFNIVSKYVAMQEKSVEVLKELLKKHPEAKVCVCTTMAQQAIIIEVIQAGAKDFIVKPYHAERVRESIKKVLG